MQFRLSCPHTSPQNGKAERHIRSLNNIIRTLLAHASMPPSFWHHALAMATYLLNILPSKVLESSSPTQILYHKDPIYAHLRVFGCLCFPLFPSSTIHKLQARSTPCVFLGYPSYHRGYKCYDISSRKIFVARHVTFDEATFPFSKIYTPDSHAYDFLENGINPYLLYQLHQPPSTSQPNNISSLAAHLNSPNSAGSRQVATQAHMPISPTALFRTANPCRQFLSHLWPILSSSPLLPLLPAGPVR